MKFKNHDETRKYADEDIEILYAECQARRVCDMKVPDNEWSSYDCIINECRVEVKRRPFDSGRFKSYFIGKDKVDALRKEDGRIYAVFLFNDRFFIVDLRKHFPHSSRRVWNPDQHRYTIQENYEVLPSQGQFYQYLAK